MDKTSFIDQNAAKKPVILMVIGGLGGGGKEQQLLSLLKGLKERNKYSVILVAMNPNGSREGEARQYVDQLIIIKRILPFAFFQPMFQVIQIARRYKASIIHTWGSGIWDLLGLCASRWLRIPFLHGGIQSAPTSLIIGDRISKWCARRANMVIANSRAGLAAFGQESNPNALVIYNGLDTSRFEGVKSEQIEYDLCMVANFSHRKDHRTMVNAMSIIIKTFPKAKLLLVGHDAGTLDSTRQLVSQLGLGDAVIFVTDCLQPWQLIANSRVGVLASYTEGISNSILEYFYFAKPVIATENAGNSEVVIPGKTGYLVEVMSAEALAEKAILLQNPDLAEQMGAAGKEMVLARFGMDKMVDSFESVYADLIQS